MATYIYKGKRIGVSDQPFGLLVRVEDGVEVDHRLTFVAKACKHLSVGGLYEIEGDDEKGTYKLSAAKWLKPWPDQGEREAMVAADRAVEASLALEKARKKTAEMDGDLTVTLRPLREVYARLPTRVQRIAFEMAVLEALRRT